MRNNIFQLIERGSKILEKYAATGEDGKRFVYLSESGEIPVFVSSNNQIANPEQPGFHAQSSLEFSASASAFRGICAEDLIELRIEGESWKTWIVKQINIVPGDPLADIVCANPNSSRVDVRDLTL